MLSTDRPLRCVAFDDVHFKTNQATSWLDSMQERYDLRARRDMVVSTTRLDMKPGEDHVYVYEFQPKSDRPIAQIAVGSSTERSMR